MCKRGRGGSRGNHPAGLVSLVLVKNLLEFSSTYTDTIFFCILFGQCSLAGSILHVAWKFTARTEVRTAHWFPYSPYFDSRWNKCCNGTVHTGAVNNSLYYFKGKEKSNWRSLRCVNWYLYFITHLRLKSN